MKTNSKCFIKAHEHCKYCEKIQRKYLKLLQLTI